MKERGDNMRILVISDSHGQLGNLNEISNVHVNDIYKLLKSNIKGKKYIIGNKFTIEIKQKDIVIIY